MSEKNDITMGERIKRLRLQKGYTQEELGKFIGVSRASINKIENGKSFPSMQIFFYICEYLKITPQEFFDSKVSNPSAMAEVIQDLEKLNKEQFENVTGIIKGLIK